MSIEYIIFFLALFGCGYTSWQIGVRQGAENAVEILHSMKVISYNKNGDIIPYKNS